MTGLAGAAAGVTILVLVAGSLRSTRASLERRIVAKTAELQEIGRLRGEVLRLRGATPPEPSPNDDGSFSLFSFVESVGSRSMNREKILAMNPSERAIGDEHREEAVELRLSAVEIDRVVSFLHEIQSAAQPLYVSRLVMKKRYNDPRAFDVTLVVATLVKVDE